MSPDPSQLTIVASVTTKVVDGKVAEVRDTLSDGSVITAGWKPGPILRPMSASGCSIEVCIDVEGHGLYVDSWSTTAFGNVGCSYAVYKDNGKYLRITDSICPTSSGDGVYFYTWAYPAGGKFPNHTQLCNTWYYVRGTPCEWVSG